MLTPEVARDDRRAEALRDEPGPARGRPAAPRRRRTRRCSPTCRGRPSSRPSRSPAAPSGCSINGVWPDYGRWMNRPIAMGRGLTDDDERRRSTVAVVGATLGSKLFGGADPVGRDITVEGVRFRVVGVQAPSQIFTEELWYDANGISIPLQTYMDRIDATHALSNVAVKLKAKKDDGRGLGDDDGARPAGAPRHRGFRDQGPRGGVRARVGAVRRPDPRLEGRADEPRRDRAARRRRRASSR